MIRLHVGLTAVAVIDLNLMNVLVVQYQSVIRDGLEWVKGIT